MSSASPVDRLQPRTVGQLLDGGFEVLRFRFRTIAIVAAPIVLPLIVVPQLLIVFSGGTVASGSVFSGESNPFFSSNGVDGALWGTVLLAYLAGFGLMVAQMLVGVGITHLVTGWLAGSDPTARETLRFIVRRSPVAMGAFGLAFLIKVVAAIPCGLGLLYAIPALAVLAPVVAAEPVGVRSAVSRTMALGRRRLGPILGLCLLWWVVSYAVTAGTQLAAGAIGAYIEGSLVGAAIALQAISVLTTLVLLVVQVSVTVLVYIDLRVRTEGLDLELDAGSLFESNSVR